MILLDATWQVFSVILLDATWQALWTTPIILQSLDFKTLKEV